jgi:hypothetical protein
MKKQGESAKESDSLVTLQEANEILIAGYPSPEQLSRFPLGDLLECIPGVDARYREKESGHIDKVIEGMNFLLSNPTKIVADWQSQAPPQEAAEFMDAFAHIFYKTNGGPYYRLGNKEPFFRLLALYHDIGKSITIERHPLVGWHLLRDVHRERVQKELFPLILGRDYDTWQSELAKGKRVDEMISANEKRMLSIFEATIRYHDYFGVLSTGEASLPLAVDLVGLRGTDPADARELFSVLMILNFADLYGSVPKVIPHMVKQFVSDWKILCDTIGSTDVNGDRSRFFMALRERAQRPIAAIDRLWRLVFAGEPEMWQNQISQELVEEVVKEIAFANISRFITNFALFCKLDYCLSFKKRLMEEARNQGQPVSAGINRTVSLLAALENRYGDLCQRSDGTWRRLGVELVALTRRPPPGQTSLEGRSGSRIAETIAQLLLSPAGAGIVWAVGDCTVWFMEE